MPDIDMDFGDTRRGEVVDYVRRKYGDDHVALLFPLCLVLYEFSTYIGNDMIQPGMLAVVEQYQAGIDWVPTCLLYTSRCV